MVRVQGSSGGCSGLAVDLFWVCFGVQGLGFGLFFFFFFGGGGEERGVLCSDGVLLVSVSGRV